MPSTPRGMRKAVVEDTLLLKVVQRYFKLAGIASVVWVVGYFKISVSWLWLLLVLYVWKEKHSKAKLHRKIISQELARNEKEVILARVEDLPSWDSDEHFDLLAQELSNYGQSNIQPLFARKLKLLDRKDMVNFPDVERAEWVNKMLNQMWPYIGQLVEKILRESVENSIKQSLPATLQSFKFSKIDLGNIPPRIGGVKVYTQVKRDEIYMDLELNYSSDSNIEVTIKGMSAGIKNMRIHGTLRVVFRPLINKIPLIGGMLVFFLNNPELDFEFTSLANALELPGLSDMLYSSIQEQISNFIVLPNRYPIKMVDGLDLNKLRYPQPQGVVRIKVMEAKDLIKADIGITGMAKSDPYCKIRVGAKQVRTKVIQNSLNPTWDETFDLIVDAADGQLLYIDVLDEDPGLVHDELGSISLDLAQLKDVGFVDEWLPLEEVKHGMIHVQLTWLWLANQSNELDRVIEKVVDSLDDQIMHAAILMVYLDSGRNLPVVEDKKCKTLRSPCRAKKSMIEPSPQVVLTVGQQVQESLIKYATSEPRWEQNFRFLMHNPNYQNLDISLMDAKTKKPIGTSIVKIKQLLIAEDMVMDQKFRIKTSDPDTHLQLRLCLRILTSNFNPDYIDDLESLITDPALTGTAVDEVRDDGLEPWFGKDVAPEVGTPVDLPPPPIRTTSQQTDVSPEKATSGVDAPVNGGKHGPSSTEPESGQPRLRKSASLNYSGKHGLGRIQVTLRYNSQVERLILVVHKCAYLKPVAGDNKNMADPFIRLYLLPDKSSASKRRTKVVKNCLHPVFDETFEYTLALAEVARRQLWITVKNDVSLFSTTKTEMGQVLLDLGTLDITRAVTECNLTTEEMKKEKPWHYVRTEDGESQVIEKTQP